MTVAARRPRNASLVGGGPRGASRKSTNLTLATSLVDEARSLEVNLSQAAEEGIAAAVARRRQERWLVENQDALQSSNTFIDQHDLPLARYRTF